MKQPRATSLAVESLVGIVALMAAIVAHHVTADDQWTHILTGRLILEDLRMPLTDPFSFTYGGQPWVPWEWLGGVVLAWSWDLGGVAGLYALRFLAVAITVAVLIAELQRTRAERPTATLLIVCLLILCLQPRVGDRPYMWTFPCLALTLWWGRSVAAQPTWRGFIKLFLLFLAWTGLHPSSWMGLGLMGALCLQSVLDRWPGGGPGEVWRLHRGRLLLPLGLATTALTNPNLRHYGHKLSVILSQRVSGEWSSLAEHATHGHPWFYVYLLLVAALAATFVVDAPTRRSLLAWFVVALAVYAFVHGRFVAMFSIVALPVLYSSATRWLPVAEGFGARARGMRIAILCVTALAVFHETDHVYGGFDVALDPNGHPIAQADFMERARIEGNVFTPTRGASSYLSMRLWPEVKIFIDGRVPQLFPTDFADAHAAADHPDRFMELVHRYDFDHVVVPGGVFSSVGRHWAKVLHQSEAFRLVHFDQYGMLWSRLRESGLACAPCDTFEVLQPWRVDAQWARRVVEDHGFDAVADELARLADLEGSAPIAREMANALARGSAITDTQRVRLRPLMITND